MAQTRYGVPNYQRPDQPTSRLVPVAREDVAAPDLLADSDSGVGTDAGDVFVTLSSSDSGTGTETGVVSATVAGADAGTGTDAQVSIVSPVSGSDTATGSETGSASVTAPGSDTGTGTEGGVVTETGAGGEGGAGTETGTVSVTASSTDTSSGSEAGTASVTATGADTSSGTDAGTASVTASGADSGTGTDAGSVSDITGGPTPVSGSDSGTGTDVGTVVDLTPPVEPPVTPDAGGGGRRVVSSTDYGDETAIYGEPTREVSGADMGVGIEFGVVVDLTPAPERPRLRVRLPRLRATPEVPRETFRALVDGDVAAGRDEALVGVSLLSDDAAVGSEGQGDMQDVSESSAEEWQVLALLGVL